jgi:hypothetical protein
MYHRRLLTAVGMSINLLLVSNVIFRRQSSSSTIDDEVSFLDPSGWDTRRESRESRHRHRLAQRRSKNEVANDRTATTVRNIDTVKQNRREDDDNLLDCGIKIDNDNGYTCNLRDSSLGTPTILISFGCSGSSATWQLMSAMTGNYTFEATEDTGSSTKKSLDIFNNIFNQSLHGKCWIRQLLCTRQHHNRQRRDDGQSMAGIYGFKWKPYFVTFGSNKSIEALQWLSHNSHVRVVNNRRNLLDVIISRYKHEDRSVRSHCTVGDDDCITKHKSAKPTLPTRKGGRLINILESLEEETNHADQLLDEYNVPHIDVSYEKLYTSHDIAIEWKRLFTFLGVGPTSMNDQLTSKELIANMEHAATSSLSFRDKVQNYDEVVNILHGTEYEKYLSK